MTFWKTVLLEWDWEPSIIAGCAALLIGYAAASRLRFKGIAAYFIAGVVVMFLALVSPLDTMADNYLFSAHMFQHLLLSQVVPPLLLLGIPAAWWERVLRWQAPATAERFLRKPVIAWLCGIVALWIWHWPRLFDLALRNENVHIFQHLCFMVTGCVFWWPVVSPLPGHRMTTFPAVFYLFTACTVSSLLGIFITFASAQLYPFYASGADPFGILRAAAIAHFASPGPAVRRIVDVASLLPDLRHRHSDHARQVARIRGTIRRSVNRPSSGPVLMLAAPEREGEFVCRSGIISPTWHSGRPDLSPEGDRTGWSEPSPRNPPQPTFWPAVMALAIMVGMWGILLDYIVVAPRFYSLPSHARLDWRLITWVMNQRQLPAPRTRAALMVRRRQRPLRTRRFAHTSQA